MNRSPGFARRVRWAVPAGAVAAVGVVIAGSMIAGASAAPALPARTAAQLLADIAGKAAPPPPLSGVIVQTAALGLPQLPAIGGSTSALSLLAGSHTVKLWYSDPQHVRFAVPAQLGETDLRRDGRQVWLWSSSTQTATHLVLPAQAGLSPAARRAAGECRFGLGSPAGESTASVGPLTPLQAARAVLAAVGPTTAVSVQQNVMVAGQAAYQLAIAPKDSRSLIGEIRIAVDAHGYLPLRLQVFARGAASPAFQVGFTALSFTQPAASNFTFTPPPGAKVKNVQIPLYGWTGSRPGQPGGLPTGLSFPAPRNQPKSGIRLLPSPRAGGVERALRRAAPCAVRRAAPRCGMSQSGMMGSGALASGMPGSGALSSGMLSSGLAAGAGPTVIGTGWLSVLVLPPGGANATQGGVSFSAVPQSSAVRQSSASFSSVSQSGSSSMAYSSTVTISAPAGPAGAGGAGGAIIGTAGPTGADLALLRAVLRAATPVHGPWGSGRLLRTSLLSILITSKGQILVGAVVPSVLYAAAAKVK